MSTSTPGASPVLTPGLTGHAEVRVTEALCAPAVGSGAIMVYATPSMVALMEAAAVACVEHRLAPGQASLGVQIEVSHTAGTPVGLAVYATATLVAVDGRKLTFEIEARDSKEKISTARHTRVVVDAERFKARIASKSA